MDDLLNFADLDTFAHNRAGTGPDRTEEKAEAAAKARAAYKTREADLALPAALAEVHDLPELAEAVKGSCKAAAARAAEG